MFNYEIRCNIQGYLSNYCPYRSPRSIQTDAVEVGTFFFFFCAPLSVERKFVLLRRTVIILDKTEGMRPSRYSLAESFIQFCAKWWTEPTLSLRSRVKSDMTSFLTRPKYSNRLTFNTEQ